MALEEGMRRCTRVASPVATLYILLIAHCMYGVQYNNYIAHSTKKITGEYDLVPRLLSTYIR